MPKVVHKNVFENFHIKLIKPKSYWVPSPAMKQIQYSRYFVFGKFD